MARRLAVGAFALLAQLETSASQSISVEVTAGGAGLLLPQTEAEVEDAEDVEAALLDFRLLQKPVTPPGALTESSAAEPAARANLGAAAVEEQADSQALRPSTSSNNTAASAVSTAPAEQNDGPAVAAAEEQQALPLQRFVESDDTVAEVAAPAEQREVHAAVAQEKQEVLTSAETPAQEKSAGHQTSQRSKKMSSLQITAEVSQAEVEIAGAAIAPQHAAFVQAAFSSESLQAAIPGAASIIGFALMRIDGCRTFGLLMVYFGVQTGLNLYMKIVLSNTVVSKERGMKGIPGAFLITALQQVVAFLTLAPVILALWPTRWRYTPKPLTSRKAWAGVCCLSLTFAMNIGLNNLCLSLLPMSINLMIRSCVPLATWAMQGLVSMVGTGSFGGRICSLEFMLMLAGVFFAGLASIAKEEGSSDGSDSQDLGLGIIVGVLSIIACAFYLILAQWLGQDVKLNPLDMTLYMSVPAALFLVPLMLWLHHPVGWKGFGPMTDWQVMQEVVHLAPVALVLAAMSGVFALLFNTLSYTLVSELSATHTAFAGNFNKAATIVMSIVLGLETLPAPPWGQVTLLSIVGGIGSFTAYSVIKVTSGKSAH